MRIVERIALVSGAVRGLVRRSPPPRLDPEREDPRERKLPMSRDAELAVAALLVVGGLLAAAFAVLVVVHPDTQLLGGVLGGGLACLGVGLALASKRVVVQEVHVEERHPPSEREAGALARDLREGAQGISRRKLLLGAAGVAACGVAGAAVVPVTALGPGLGDAPNRSPWRRGRRLVDARTGKPIRADELEVGSFQSAMPEGGSSEELTAPVVVVRVEARALRLPPERRTWAPQGLLAFSQICTHAACAVTLFRYPVNEQTSKPPALVCPCHYSTFDVLRGAKPVFGPAVRALPQLPLAIADDGTLVADGPLSGSVGPSYWGVRQS